MATLTDLQRKDFAGNLLPVSGVFTKLITGTSAVESLTGTSGNDVFQTRAGDTLIGGAGDDTYVVQYRDQIVIEQPGQGIDTVKTTSSYILPDNVENLYASGLPIVSGASVAGNSLANIIIGDSNPQIIAGAGGNDVLTGGGGSDTFLFRTGSGHDVISDFQTGALADGGDVLRLQDYSFKGLSDLRAAMTQVGADVVIKLSSSDDVTLRNVKIGDFTDANFQPGLDRSQLKLAFGDEFSAASLDWKTASNPDGKWIPEFGFGGIGSKASHYIGVYTREQNIYVDPSYKGRGSTPLGLDPFELDGGILTINSGIIPDSAKSALYDHIPYYSGMLRATVPQTYGYFEMRAQFPSQSGSWPAFWLTPGANAAREIDIFEHYGNDDYIRTTVHDTTLTNGKTGQLAYVPDSTTTFHTYGMKWTAQTLTWYVDGQQIFQTATPVDMNGPMYININLPVGGVAGVVDPNDMPVGYKIDYVRAYSLVETPQLPAPQPAPPPHAGSGIVDDVFYYANNKDVLNAKLDATEHYNQHGWIEGRDPNAQFSTIGYLAANLDVKAAGMNPLTHYVANGWKEGRDPGAHFDNELYLARNPDVKAAGIDPLAHYLANGQSEGRQAYAAVGKAGDLGTHPGFDAEYYLLSNSDVAKAALATGGDSFAFAYQHYQTDGWREGRDPNAVFDTTGYLATYMDVAAAGIDPLSHYHQYGFKEGRDPSGNFDTNAYEAAYGDVKMAGLDPMLHYLQYGAVEGRSAFADGHFS